MSYGWAKDAEGLREVAVLERRLAVLGHVVVEYERYSREAEELERLRAIVADLAAVECPVTTIVSYVTGDEDGLCPTCDAVLESDSIETTEHEPSCPWRRARDWVDGHVVVTDAGTAAPS